MKKIITLLPVLFICLSICGQKKVMKFKAQTTDCKNPVMVTTKRSKTIEYFYTYDYSKFTKQDDCSFMPRHNKDRVYINITNINRLVFDIQAQGTAQSITLPNISLFDSLAASIKTSSISSTTATVESPANSVTSEKTIKTKGKLRKVTVTKPDPYFKQKSEIEAQQLYINSNFKSWIEQLQKLEFFANYSKNAASLVASECCSQNNLKSNLITEPNVLLFDDQVYNPLTLNVANDFNRLISSFNTQPPQIAKAVKEELEKMKKAKAKADELISDIVKLCENEKKTASPECQVDNLKDNYPDDFDKAVAAAEKIDLQKITEATGELNLLLQKVNSEKNFNYDMLTPFKISGDTYDAKVILKPKQASANLFQQDSITNSFLVKGRFEWAIGPGINFHVSKSLLDESFQIDSSRNVQGAAKTDTFTITRNPLRNKMMPSVGIMAHFYWQQHSAVTPGIVIGLATSPSELKDLRAYLGLSLMAGDLSNKVFLNMGFAFGWSNRLKANLVTGENPKSQIPFTGDKVASPEQLVERAFHTGLFFGLTYKLGN